MAQHLWELKQADMKDYQLNRVCEVCDSDNVEDEMHFLISCNALTQ